MSTNLKAAVVVSFAFALLPGAVLADSPDLVPNDAPYQQVQKTCAEALRDAQFLREMMKTDGDTNPELPPVGECRDETK